jgi:hypothetical protein
MIERVAASYSVIGIDVGVAVRCLCVAACQPTPYCSVLELWYKETDHLKDMCNNISVLPV